VAAEALTGEVLPPDTDHEDAPASSFDCTHCDRFLVAEYVFISEENELLCLPCAELAGIER
jgi:hypothetical protein